MLIYFEVVFDFYKTEQGADIDIKIFIIILIHSQSFKESTKVLCFAFDKTIVVCCLMISFHLKLILKFSFV